MKVLFWSKVPFARVQTLDALSDLDGVEVQMVESLDDCIAAVGDVDLLVTGDAPADEAARVLEALRAGGRADAIHFISAGRGGFEAAGIPEGIAVTGPIGGEFARVLSEIQIGKSRADAFASLGERTTAPEVKTFVSALVQADRMGLPIAAVLREQTKEMRVARRQRAEEQAQKVTVKILFPLIFCILPALFIVVIGPAGINIFRNIVR